MRNTRRRKGKTGFVRLSKARLDELVEEAIVDCYNESEQVTGLYTMIEDNLGGPLPRSSIAVTAASRQRVDRGLSPLVARRLGRVR